MGNKDNWIILIVDDEQIVHTNLEITLRKMEHNDKGVEFMHAYSGEEAREIIVATPEIAVIVLDVMMEKNDAGLSFIEFLRDEAKNSDTRVILYTGQPGYAPKQEVADKYIIDGYLDKNTSDKQDCYVSVRLALTSYEERLKLRELSKKDDVALLSEIAEAYVWFLETQADTPGDYNTCVEKINAMLHLTQEILASYGLRDVKEGLSAGTTKTERLSREEYQALINIHHIKLILSHTSVQEYEASEKSAILATIVKSSHMFSSIRILPDTAKAALKECLEKYNLIS